MSDAQELKAGDPCPQCGGELAPDPRLDPEAVIDRHTRNAQIPAAAARFAVAVRAKAKERGVIHTCRSCGYQARFPLERPGPGRGRSAA